MKVVCSINLQFRDALYWNYSFVHTAAALLKLCLWRDINLDYTVKQPIDFHYNNTLFAM